ncbi:hypothetical protein GCM10022226_13500 [Sphaerisporangium flaviroseum]|uniref:Uncharacterized protein n=1 Tax=Sphaerisporangium flaviroseum TaxID=509199 RepID=A0ABP7HI15_9ACTN
MTAAQPLDHNWLDPEEILRRLPVDQRERFVHEYRSALDAAHEVWRYRQLQEVLHLWNLRAAAYAQPDFQQRAAEAAGGEPGLFVSVEQIPGWTGQAR